MSIKKAISTALVGTALIASGILTAAPAQAATSNCPSGYTCLWEDKDYKTNGHGEQLIKFQRYITNLGTVTYQGTQISGNDTASSAYNHGRYASVVLWENANRSSGEHGAWGMVLYRGATWSAGPNTAEYNDAISSGYFVGY